MSNIGRLALTLIECEFPVTVAPIAIPNATVYALIFFDENIEKFLYLFCSFLIENGHDFDASCSFF